MTDYQLGDDVTPAPKVTKTPIAPPKKQDRTTMALLFVAAFVAVGGIGFAVGHLTAAGATAAVPSAAAGRPGGFGPGGGRAVPSLAPGQTFDTSQFGGGAAGRGLQGVAGGVTGTVQAVSPTSITIQTSTGTSETIDISGTTTYHSEAAAGAADIKVGTSVTVQIDTAALASQSPNPSASGGLGGRSLTAKDVLITQP